MDQENPSQKLSSPSKDTLLTRLRQYFFGHTQQQPRAALGHRGERKAARFLKDKGLRIITRNWRSGRNEIDLVAWDGPVLVFIEVRTRRAAALISGYHSIDKRKKRALARVCKAYLAALSHPPHSFRFDVVEVRLGKEGDLTVNHYENIPLFHRHYLPPRRLKH